MKLLDRLTGNKTELRYSIDDYALWMQNLNWPYNAGSLVQTYGNESKVESPTSDYMGHAAQFVSNGPVYSLMAIRLRLFSQVRWAYQQLRSGRPGDLFSNPALDLVNGDPYLNSWMIRHVDLAGNFYGRVEGQTVYPMRPDWVSVICNAPLEDYDSEVIGYAYQAGGPGKTSLEQAEIFQTSEVIHWMPEPDPYARYRGMSWLTPVIREVSSDAKMVKHKEKYLDNAATPNMVVRIDKDTSFENFKKFKEIFQLEHEGAQNAYKTLFLGGGADATIVGSDFKQLDFTAVSGKGETRLANAAGVHPVVVGFSEGMQGSSLNAGNFGQARRSTADSLLHPLWVSASGAIGKVIAPPSGSRLWYDAREVPFLREDAKDDADIKAKDAGTIGVLVTAGFTPESSVAAVATGDWTLLKHTGLFSVQLQPPMTTVAPVAPPAGRMLKILRDEHGFMEGVALDAPS